jgi:large repetitive protein
VVRRRRSLLVALVSVLVVGGVVGVASALDAEGERLPDAIVGQPYEADLEASGGCIPYTFTLDSGYLPPGLTVDPNPTYSTGKIEGTPTASGWFDWYLEVTDICGSKPSQEVWTIYIHPPLVITTKTLPPAQIGRPYSARLAGDSGDPSVLQWSLGGGSLPAGLTLAQDGAITGTPTAAGTSTFVAKVHDGNVRTTTKELSITVGTQLQAAAPSLPRGEVGVGYAARLQARGGFSPYTWAVSSGALPAGLKLDTGPSATAGVITGRPATAGTSAVRFTVTDAAGATAETAGTIRIAARLRIATAALPAASAGSAYRARLATSGGQRPVRWTRLSGALPRGLTLNPRTGVLAGTPRSAGTFRFTLRATDALGGSARKAFRLVVAP